MPYCEAIAALKELTEAICAGRYEDPSHDRIYCAIQEARRILAHEDKEEPKDAQQDN